MRNANASSTLPDFVSTLDPVGNPTQLVQTGAVSTTETYGYDANDRLASLCFQAAGSCPGAADLPPLVLRQGGKPAHGGPPDGHTG